MDREERDLLETLLVAQVLTLAEVMRVQEMKPDRSFPHDQTDRAVKMIREHRATIVAALKSL